MVSNWTISNWADPKRKNKVSFSACIKNTTNLPSDSCIRATTQGPAHNFEVAILKLDLDILDLEIGILSLAFAKL